MMTIEDGLLTEDMVQSFMKATMETLDYCDQCENEAHDFIKIANCILDRQEYDDFLSRYRKFENNFGILESLVAQMTYPASILQAISISAVIKELQHNLDDLIEVMEQSDVRIESEEINVPMAQLIDYLIEYIEFDAIDYDDLAEAIEHTFLVIKVLDVFDHDYKQMYYPMNILQIKSFDTKAMAYAYALQHGISKDFILNRHGNPL